MVGVVVGTNCFQEYVNNLSIIDIVLKCVYSNRIVFIIQYYVLFMQNRRKND